MMAYCNRAIIEAQKPEVYRWLGIRAASGRTMVAGARFSAMPIASPSPLEMRIKPAQ
jgi:hypothetical protein